MIDIFVFIFVFNLVQLSEVKVCHFFNIIFYETRYRDYTINSSQTRRVIDSLYQITDVNSSN